jgi:hypothetical protein
MTDGIDAIERGDPWLSYASGLNSTTATLAGGATFEGTKELNGAPEVFVMTKSDVSGTLYFDFSNDGTNWDSTYPVNGYACGAGVPEVHKAVKSGRYFRLRYVNDSDAQSYFRLTCYFGATGDLMASANQAVGRDSDANVVRVYADPQDEIVLGQRTGVRHYTKFGYLPDIDSADGALMITADPAKPAAPEVLTSGETFSIAFDDTNDGESTNGALTLYIDYVDSNGAPAIATHTLTGTSPDTTSFSGLGINRVAVASSGSTDTNSGAITITSSSSGGVHAYVPAGEGVTQQALFHTPSNAQCVAKFLFGNVNKLSGSSPLVTIKGWVHNRTVDTKFEVFRFVMDTATTEHFEIVEPVGFKLSAGDILYFTADTDRDNTVVGSFRFSLNEYENN